MTFGKTKIIGKETGDGPLINVRCDFKPEIGW